ncbi:IS1-like element transposase [Chroococcidiopsis sp. CCMEE 29]|uniref:IS1/IS1595 family N-terminal zinc-binding domain-containing protein n=1 Tax=Chroococcidiopsis sp. CCMEE 29 TaxID=155894 RepID=UPI0020203BF9|nr:IS1-like element transposase [Chroococcidiopsis sp. CCMEE 29]
MMTVWLAIHCPHCQSTDVKKHGTSSNGKRRYRCLNPDCPYETFSQSIDYPGRRREVKQQIVEMTLNGSGVRDIARVLHVSTATVIQELKKNSPIAMRQSVAVEPTPTRPSGGSG